MWDIVPRKLLSYHNFLLILTILSLIFAVGDRIWIELTDGDAIMKRPSRSSIPDLEFTGVAMTTWIWLISARVLIVAMNISFVTVMWVIPNIFEEITTWKIEMNCRFVNWIFHRFAGIWLIAVPTVLHVVVLVTPAITDRIDINLKYDGFNWDEWWDPCVKAFGPYVTSERILYTWDEVFRFSLIIVIFCLLLPLSRSNWMLAKSFSVAMGVHAFAGFAFMVDMVRKNSHPLCWRFNFPFIILYCLDRIIAMFFYRVNRFKVHEIRECSDNTFILLGKIDNLPFHDQACADNFWLLHRFHKRHLCTPVFQRAHPYTGFQNWDKGTRHLWNVGFVINVNKANKKSWSLWLMERNENRIKEHEVGQDNPAFTGTSNDNTEENWSVEMREVSVIEINKNKTLDNVNAAFQDDRLSLASDEGPRVSVMSPTKPSTSNSDVYKVQAPPRILEFDLRSWGPYRSAFYVVGDFASYEKLVLIAGGSGFGLVLSAVALISNWDLNNPDKAPKMPNVTVVFSAREKGLMIEACRLLQQIPNYESVKYLLRYTGPGEGIESQEPLDVGVAGAEPFCAIAGRLDTQKVFKKLAEDKNGPTLICACAAKGLLGAVEKSNKKYKFRLRVEQI